MCTLTELSFKHDNARPHCAAVAQAFFARRNINLIYQSAYSPDFNLLDRWVNAHLKSHFKHMVFTSALEVEGAALQVLKSTPDD